MTEVDAFVGDISIASNKKNSFFSNIIMKVNFKDIFFFVISNVLLFLILWFIYQNVERTIFILCALIVGLCLMNPISYFLHMITLWVCKKKVKGFRYFKTSSLISESISFSLIFILGVLYFVLIFIPQINNKYTVSLLQTMIILGCVMLYGINFLISLKVSNKLSSRGILHKLINSIIICSYEFFLSDRMKKCVSKSSASNDCFKGAVVKYMNYTNLIFSGFISISYILFSPKVLEPLNNNIPSASCNLFLVISLLLVVRTISRSTEIICAFFIDTVDKNIKTTNIQPHERVLLAILSLIEITVLFSAVYLFIKIMSFIPEIPNVPKEIDGVYFLFYSFGITTYKSIDFYMKLKTESIAIVLHVITSMVLMVFTFARYIGEIKDGKN